MPNDVSGRVVKIVTRQVRAPRHRQVELSALALPDPVPLHGQHALGPAGQPVAPGQELLGIVGDLEEPALDLLGHDLRVAAPAAPVLDLLVGEDGLARGAPVDPGSLLVRQAALEHADEDELLPAIVGRVARGELAVPVVGHAEPPELRLHVGDVLVRPHGGVHAVVDGGVLGRHAEGVPAHGVQHVVAAHPLEARQEIADRVHAHVAHVDAAGRVREHLEAVVLRPRGILGDAELPALLPDPLPLRLDLTEGIAVCAVVGGHIRADFPTLSRRDARKVPGGACSTPGERDADYFFFSVELDCRRGLLGLRHGLGVLAGVVKRLRLGGERVGLLRGVVGLAGGRVLDLLDQQRTLVRERGAGGRQHQDQSHQDLLHVFTPFRGVVMDSNPVRPPIVPSPGGSRVEEVVDALGELRGDLGHGRELGDRGPAHRPGRAQGLEQTRPERGPHAGDLVQHRADGPPGAELLVVGDGEAVGLVADLLERVERGRGQVQHERLEPVRRVDLLRPLGQRDHGHVVETDGLERLEPRAPAGPARRPAGSGRGGRRPSRGLARSAGSRPRAWRRSRPSP